MAKMYGKFRRERQNFRGWAKSGQRQIELTQAIKDSGLLPLTGHVKGQICHPWGSECGEIQCANFYYTMREQDEWDTWTPLSVFETYPVMYTTES